MASQLTGVGTEDGAGFGANEWLVEELYEQYQVDKDSVDQSWWPALEAYARTRSQSDRPVDGLGASAPTVPAEPQPSGSAAAAPAETPAPITTSIPVARTTSLAPKPTPVPAEAPAPAPAAAANGAEDAVSALKGMSKALAANMELSLTVPTATSVRTIPAKLMIDNRIVINNHMGRTRGGKVSFTHILGWALIQVLKEFPSQNVYYDVIDGKPSIIAPAHVGLGIAIDLPKPDGSRSLVVPAIKRAETLSFTDYLAAYEDLVKRARGNKLTADDFAGATVSLTNPGGIGTVHSVPRLMKGQGCIIGAGALEYPAEFQGARPQLLADLGISKTITLTSTYDHRVIQGAGSGEFLKLVHELLIGGRGFYEGIFAALRIPYDPIHWANDITIDEANQVDKTARVQELINAFRVRGHLMADIDPLEYKQRTHPDLDLASHGLTFWDLDREFVVGGFAGRGTMLLREVLDVLHDSYCRTVGVEYMHISDPTERRWFQDKLERPYVKPTHDEQLHILEKLNQAEAFETFLQTKFVGQKRFSLEGGESTIPLLDELLQASAGADLDGVAIGMAHRGRLNVLTSIAGKTYEQIFREFEGDFDLQGSGDVKYHLGTEGTFVTVDGKEIPVYVAANPSHLEVVNGVLEGIVRAKQDRKPIATFTTLPVLVHGDAALVGQGINAEVLQMSQLRAYRTGGTVHVNINNQIGFTTPVEEARSSKYSTDIAKSVQAPVFHVNGDDPEAVVRVARLAFEYRQAFHRDVFIDLICYRRRGHNEGDDPSMTQPLMYSLIDAKRSTRKLYTEALVGRGDITQEEYDAAQASFRERLERAFAETHAAQTSPIPIIAQSEPEPLSSVIPVVSGATIQLIGDAHANQPNGFTAHPKLQQNVLSKRVDMSRNGSVDWGFGELLAFGSLLVEGTPVRLVGQDSRRGTFAQRHAVFFDQVNGQEWIPLVNLAENQGRFYVYDSLLSEYAAMGFEYGYSVERAEALVLWEAQYGDFANGAQIVIDQYISASEQKWGQRSSVVLLLPHGYEGQGPDHSSARIERYLSLAAQDNMTIARPSTPASYFHLLRRQAYALPRKPLIVFTPKAMLRLRGATSEIADFTSGSFQGVIDDPDSSNPAAVRRVLMVAGKIYYDLKSELAKAPNPEIAVVRLEQFYPVPDAELLAVKAKYPAAEFVWVQDEPRNQGAAPFLNREVRRLELPGFRIVSRPISASPAAGTAQRHQAQQATLLAEALSF
ncbi:multifunctional oxoglutarate decarboxylase/oxoglutarate dehydrogenase thiamine pyrophosphate-binding subunit/dihydrolipoyllysine-residue succinyltransferase subunit [Gryllotalpicola sp.]|uniref:multifunctional oxoglutarate decarboxylase/oxoglutarate dehydrogenase thiamine pyrophosphate-binding subunit/dihydrolipoyllysine-residue succinyltransferase subunit n=1 Tax=Gryllotalpicola sp. TaxID=1932787 RepID=UPI002622DDA9|nr:multifunctional oxoglutarate decarboxylase/oxoglutarate dehydrogenase thiamine pyrophosphate-binding subunit/dihydrolipoyllysine-residue succinyltransferase subunit [Gryllotalpicola sp.]